MNTRDMYCEAEIGILYAWITRFKSLILSLKPATTLKIPKTKINFPLITSL